MLPSCFRGKSSSWSLPSKPGNGNAPSTIGVSAPHVAASGASRACGGGEACGSGAACVGACGCAVRRTRCVHASSPSAPAASETPLIASRLETGAGSRPAGAAPLRTVEGDRDGRAASGMLAIVSEGFFAGRLLRCPTAKGERLRRPSRAYSRGLYRSEARRTESYSSSSSLPLESEDESPSGNGAARSEPGARLSPAGAGELSGRGPAVSSMGSNAVEECGCCGSCCWHRGECACCWCGWCGWCWWCCWRYGCCGCCAGGGGRRRCCAWGGSPSDGWSSSERGDSGSGG
mmetsp:Transcript_22730/g.66340  ORF Transcript_22730/g.66340 Transcript_22730/m.66340 type:complete len:290 (+) Transcript_22730:825-1694(+)